MSDIGELVQRLWNWGSFCRIDPDKPDCSCENPIWNQWIPRLGWEEGWGSEEPVKADKPEIDELDAETIDGWVRQLSMTPKRVLIRRFVLRVRTPWQEVDPAVRALQDLIDANRLVVDRMEGRHG